MISKELLRRYLDGLCTKEEALFVQQYLTRNEKDITALDDMLNDAWEQSRHAIISEEETARHLQKLQAQLYPATPAKVRTMQGLFKKYIGYAAAVLIIALSIPFFITQRHSATTQQAASILWDSAVNQSTASLHIVLPDQSVTWLSPNSRLYWNMQSKSRRMVKLEGEAFFDVAHDPAHPFTVQTGAIITKVLGTAFNIEAYGQEAALRISLVRGKVSVEKQVAGSDTTITMETLKPGEMITWHKAQTTLRKDPLLITAIDQWTSGYLVLNDVSLADALERIAARCHFTIHYSDVVKNSHKRVSTIFRNETPEQMLDIVGFITGCKYKKKTNEQIEIF